MLNKNAKFNIKCPKCQHSFPITIKQAIEDKKAICPNCQRTIEIRGDLAKKLKEVEKSLKDLGDQLKRTFK